MGIGERIKQRRKSLKLSQEALGNIVGVTKASVSAWERDEAIPTGTNIVKIARALSRSEQWITEGFEGNLPAINSIDKNLRHYIESIVYVHGEVRAGQPANIGEEPLLPYEAVGYHRVPDDRFPDCERFALKVVGDSMNLVAPHGSVVVCVKLIDAGYSPKNGDIVVALHRTPQGFQEATLKEYVESAGQVYLWPRSDNPNFQTPIKFEDHGEDDHTLIYAIAIKVIRDL